MTTNPLVRNIQWKTKQNRLKSRYTYFKNLQTLGSVFASYCYNIAHAQTRHCSRSCSDNMDFRNLIKRGYVVTFWIYSNFSTVLDVVWPGSRITCRQYPQCTNDIHTHVRCTREVRQDHLWKIVRIPWTFFQRINHLLFLKIPLLFIQS